MLLRAFFFFFLNMGDNGRGIGYVGCGGGRVRVYIYVCVFIHNTPRFHSQTSPGQAPATLVYAGSFISSPITGPWFPLWCWTGFKTLIITTVTSERRACESGDQLVGFFPQLLSTCLTSHHRAFVFFILTHSHTLAHRHADTHNATLHSWVRRGRPGCH